MSAVLRERLMRLVRAAIAAADPAQCLAPHLPEPPKDRLIVLAAGKAAGSMAAAAARHYEATGLDRSRMLGIAVTRHGYGMQAGIIPVIEAGHPVPDEAGIGATQSVLALADSAGPDDLVLVLLSGGGSANWIAPVDGLSLGDKQSLTRALLRSGATIGEINTVRRHLSAIKGGRLAARAAPAPVLTLAISDVPGDNPEAIASGPTVPDPASLADARAILERYRIRDKAVERLLSDPANETPKPGDPLFSSTRFVLVSRPADALAAAAREAEAMGYRVENLGDALEGEAWRLGAAQAKEAVGAEDGVVFISGGEATVTVRGDGSGGPNQEYVLGAAIALSGEPGIAVIAGDTDGTDGGSGAADDPAGAIADETTIARARAAGIDPAGMLANNDSTHFFARLDDLVRTGPTYTNVNDFRAILVDRQG
ncbi:MAG: glycerate kinase [Flavobacteriaceae bacterium]